MRWGVAPVPTRALSESGLALIVLLVVALFVGLVGVAMMNDTVSELQIAVNQSNAVQARYLAEAGIAAAVNQLTRDNTWVGPLTQSVPGGQGSYTVRVNTGLGNSAVKVIDSTGSVSGSTASAATQLVRETFLVLPQAFSKAVFSNTTVATCAAATCDTGGYTPTVSNTVLRQLGAIHANNVVTATTALNLVANTMVTGQVTASRGNVTPTVSPGATCIACAPATNQPLIPFPSFNFSHYQTLATSNGTFFTTQAGFDTYVGGLVTDTAGFRTINGIVFVNTSGALTLPNTTQEQNLRINGTLIVWATGPFGDLSFTSARTHNIIITAQNGEPAALVGGSVFYSGTFAGTLTVNGLFYVLDYTNSPTIAPTCPGYDLVATSAAPVTIKGMLMGQNLGCAGTNGGVDSSSVTYDPSSFFPGLPSGLVTPTSPPFVVLPISWSSGK